VGNMKKGTLQRKEWEFITRSTDVHGGKYDYSLVRYVDNKTPVTIICSQHGPFEQTPQKHKIGQGCVQCSKGKLDTASFIERSMEVHGKRYDYSNVVYRNSKTKVRIGCPKHGEFEQRASSHLYGNGCNDCANELVSNKFKLGKDEFIRRSRSIHGDRYYYDDVEYTGIFDNVAILCSEHGVFYQTPDCHLKGYNCPKCSGRISQHETKIGNFIEDLGFDVVRNSRSLIPPYEIDIYIPERDLGIEFCGLHWHREDAKGKTYHSDKKRIFDGRLITIFEDEWLTKRDAVESIIRNALGVSRRGVPGRKTIVEEVSYSDVSWFFDRYHIQGASRGSVHLAAVDGSGGMVAAMTFSKPQRQSRYQWELSRYVTDGDIHAGLATKMFSQFQKLYAPVSVVTFADRRWFDGGVYERMGFVLDGLVPVDYHYVKHDRRYHKSAFRKANIAKKFGIPIDGFTEKELMESQGYSRIWDCGKVRYVFTTRNLLSE